MATLEQASLWAAYLTAADSRRHLCGFQAICAPNPDFDAAGLQPRHFAPCWRSTDATCWELRK